MPDHPSDELLANYAVDPSRVEEDAELEAHLAGCASCREQLDELQSIEAVLAESEAWLDPDDGAPVRAPAKLSAAAARNRRENAEADALLTTILERFLSGSSSAFVWADIASQPEYHTAGVVRKLADAADAAQYSVPRRALILGEIASRIVGMLSTTTYTPAEIAALRGLSWKQQANANRQLGRFNAALAALDRAERAYREIRRSEFDLASLTFIRATLYFEQQSYGLAEQYANESTASFEFLGQTDFYFRSRHLQGCIAFDQGQIGKAQSIFDTVFAYGETTSDASWMATASLMLGYCCLERRAFTSAAQYFHQGMVAFRDLGILSAEIRCRWGLALVPHREGHFNTAISRLREVREDFVRLGDISDAALVTLDIMEAMLLLGKSREVRRTAGNIVQLFKDAGMVTGALTAADYLKQAAAIQNVTPSLIDYIRRYLRRVDHQPDLTFVPPVL